MLSARIDAVFDRKTSQLCKQVFEAMCLALAESDDPRLAEAFVVAVEPAPDASRLSVVVAANASTIDEVLAALASARPWLRAELAASIHRKRVPELCFAVAPCRKAGAHGLMMALKGSGSRSPS